MSRRIFFLKKVYAAYRNLLTKASGYRISIADVSAYRVSQFFHPMVAVRKEALPKM
jgi:hypothetical protein